VKKDISNMAASVHARLLNRAKAEGQPFNELLQYYVMERFLYRLSRSEHTHRFVLKGALMLQFWGGPLSRATKDIDLLGRSAADVSELVEVMKSCLKEEVEDDGLHFDETSVMGEEIRLAATYNGVRLRCFAYLGNARIALQIDIGFGDIVTPNVQPLQYPSLLDFAPPHLLGYTPETCIAEKFQAIVILDMANTRMKDFLDIWVLSQGREFSGALLARAVEATFRRRQTALPTAIPIALTPSFFSAPAKQAQWRAYLRKGRVRGSVPAFDEVANHIGLFLMPVVEARIEGKAFVRHWPRGGPWVDRKSSEKNGNNEDIL
jgi:hypothetical protein